MGGGVRTHKARAAIGVALGLVLAAAPAICSAGPQEDFAAAGTALDLDAMKRALDHGASPNVGADPNTPPLLVAAVMDRPDAAQLLLDHGADPNVRGGTSELHATPLIFAASSGSAAIVELLLSRGADIEAIDSHGATAIDDAAGADKLKMVALLAGAGANVNTRGGDGNTPLHFAAWNGHGDVVRLLLALGADPAARNNAGQTPVAMATQSDQISARDKADVLASLSPRDSISAPDNGAQAHGCPHTEEDLKAMAQRIVQASPGRNWGSTGLLDAMQMELRMMGCPGS